MKYIRKTGKHFATESGVKMGMRYKKCTKIKKHGKIRKNSLQSLENCYIIALALRKY
jgi:hypothetical protein